VKAQRDIIAPGSCDPAGRGRRGFDDSSADQELMTLSPRRLVHFLSVFSPPAVFDIEHI